LGRVWYFRMQEDGKERDGFHMKFEDMPYKRVEYEETEKEYRKIIEDFRKAGSGEEQFKVHERYYALNDRIGIVYHDITLKVKFILRVIISQTLYLQAIYFAR